MHKKKKCLICESINGYKKKINPYLIHEFKHSLFVIGDHQFFKGYSLILYKKHVRDITDLNPKIQTELFQEVMQAGKILQKTFSPYRLNYSCLGNLVEHIHWHIFPRYKEEMKKTNKLNPWFNSDKFNKHVINEDTAKNICEQIRKNI